MHILEAAMAAQIQAGRRRPDGQFAVLRMEEGRPLLRLAAAGVAIGVLVAGLQGLRPSAGAADAGICPGSATSGT